MADELNSSARDFGRAVLDRIGSPVTGVYILSWLLWNWKIPLIMVFGSIPPQDRVVLLEGQFHSGLQGHLFDFFCMFILPLLPAAFFLFAIPLARELYDKWLSRVEYRVARNRTQCEEDLAEEKEYRMTLKAMNAFLLSEISRTLELLREMPESKSHSQSRRPDGAVVSHSGPIRERIEHLELVQNQIRDFSGTYTGELPDRYKHFLSRWGKK